MQSELNNTSCVRIKSEFYDIYHQRYPKAK